MARLIETSKLDEWPTLVGLKFDAVGRLECLEIAQRLFLIADQLVDRGELIEGEVVPERAALVVRFCRKHGVNRGDGA